MIEQKAADVYFDIEDAILNEAFPGFKEDYLVLHSLIRKHKPKTFFEIGTNMGIGTNIICNAIVNYGSADNKNLKIIDTLPVYSLDLPTELAHISLQHPISEGKGDKVGSQCMFPYTQLRGDSMTFDYTQYPCEGYYIDGEHTEKNVYHETVKVLKQYPKIVIYHDSDMPVVCNGIEKAFADFHSVNLNGNRRFNYELYRVTDTRIAYALRK